MAHLQGHRMGVAPVTDQINPDHYKRGPVEAIDVIEAAVADAPDPVSGYLQGQCLKYLLRLWLKSSSVDDAKKCGWYLQRLIQTLEARETQQSSNGKAISSRRRA